MHSTTRLDREVVSVTSFTQTLKMEIYYFDLPSTQFYFIIHPASRPRVNNETMLNLNETPTFTFTQRMHKLYIASNFVWKIVGNH